MTDTSPPDLSPPELAPRSGPTGPRPPAVPAPPPRSGRSVRATGAWVAVAAGLMVVGIVALRSDADAAALLSRSAGPRADRTVIVSGGLTTSAVPPSAVPPSVVPPSAVVPVRSGSVRPATPDAPDLDELAAWVRTRADESWRFGGVVVEDVVADHSHRAVDVVIAARDARWADAVRFGLGDDPRIVVLPVGGARVG